MLDYNKFCLIFQLGFYHLYPEEKQHLSTLIEKEERTRN